MLIAKHMLDAKHRDDYEDRKETPKTAEPGEHYVGEIGFGLS